MMIYQPKTIKAEESAKIDEFIHFYNDNHGEMMYRYLKIWLKRTEIMY